MEDNSKNSVLQRDNTDKLPFMRLKHMFICCMMLACVVSCRRQDVKTVVVRVPDMRNRACVNIIVKALVKEAGVKGGKDLMVDIDSRTLTVKYDSLFTAKKNVEYAIAAVGFSANDIPADQKAASLLPAECRSPEPTVQVAPE